MFLKTTWNFHIRIKQMAKPWKQGSWITAMKKPQCSAYNRDRQNAAVTRRATRLLYCRWNMKWEECVKVTETIFQTNNILRSDRSVCYCNRRASIKDVRTQNECIQAAIVTRWKSRWAPADLIAIYEPITTDLALSSALSTT